MSQYYNIKGMKVRVSDHEPNTKLNGSSDIELYIKSADGMLISVESQINCICERRGYNISDFSEVINDWKDGSYNKDFFEIKKEEEDVYSDTNLQALKDNISLSNDEKLNGYTLSKSAKHPEIKALSELTGVSQSYIKKYFNIK